ncbi:hypothetical protein AVEN_186738-1, partial [Araneus ventricosus]
SVEKTTTGVLPQQNTNLPYIAKNRKPPQHVPPIHQRRAIWSRFRAIFSESADTLRDNLGHKHEIAALIKMELEDYRAWSKIIG